MRIGCWTTALLLALSSGALAQSPSSGSGQGFPSKPLRLIAPFAPGGSLDLIARGIAQKMSESTGQPVVVENRAGASGAIGSEAVAKSAPDGYTMLLGATTTHGVNPALNPKLPYDPVKDFTPISIVATIPHVIVAHPSLRVSTIPELVRLAKSRPGMAFGSAGTGSPHHLAGEMLKSMGRFEAVHVPYKGSGPALTDLVSGQLQFMSVEWTIAEPYVKAGKLVALGVATAKRVPGIDVPTVIEQGYPGFEVTAWYAIFGPAGLAEAVLGRLNAEIVKALQTPDLHERFAKLGVTPVGSTPAELGAHVRAEIARWTQVVRTAGIKAE
jgi:tripartite-type tricarboxylate transporter receptor subunit TctC